MGIDSHGTTAKQKIISRDKTVNSIINHGTGITIIAINSSGFLLMCRSINEILIKHKKAKNKQTNTVRRGTFTS